MAKHITLPPRKFAVEFCDAQTASVQGGALAVAALLEEFGLKARVAGAPSPGPPSAATRWLTKPRPAFRLRS